ncbi:MAG: acetate--CoA ligase [Rickettsiales bacterium]
MNHDQYLAWYQESVTNPDKFWAQRARMLSWHKEWDRVKDSSFAKDDLHIKWFEGGQLNVCYNCVDRHLKENADKIAIIWEPDDPTAANRTLTYKQLHEQVSIAANMLIKLGVKKGDSVSIYMPMIPEAAIAMLACSRIGAIHSVVFAGFSAEALAGRIVDSKSKIVITADGSMRGGKLSKTKESVDEAVKNSAVEKVLVYRHAGNQVDWNDARDVWWHDLAQQVPGEHEVEFFDAENPLFILYTSGSTGKPKGLLHTSAGYLLYAAVTFKYVFDYQENDVYWCTADIGWVTGHSYIVYGPLANCATTIMFEGVPTYPTAARCWEIVDKYKVNSFYTSPTAIRLLIKDGDRFLATTTRDSLRILGSVGEPINPQAWLWYNDKVGKGKCQIVDTWWQTETGGHMLTPIPYAIKTKPGSATVPFFGIKPVILDDKNQVITAPHTAGALCIADSWPGMARTVWGNHERFFEVYFSEVPNHYYSGDGAWTDEDGYFWIAGRIDDVIKVSGHRISTSEVEAAINSLSDIAESAVVGYPHDIKGQSVFAYVVKKDDAISDDHLERIQEVVKKVVGSFAKPDQVKFVSNLPKTRSGKIMRRILRKIADGEVKSRADYDKLGDVSTLINPEVIDELV